MEMNWVLGLVLVAAIVAVVVIIVERSKLAPKPTDSDYRKENEILKGQIAGLKIETEIWKERGSKYAANAETAYKQSREMLDAFTKLVTNATEIENLKALLNRLTIDNKEKK